MSTMNSTSFLKQGVEALMFELFQREPFHNLSLLYGTAFDSIPGGTCSDKTLSFVDAGRRAGFDMSLHSGLIGGEEIHRLARVKIGGRYFFADVGNGWPSLKLYPGDEAVLYHCFGMRFRTEVTARRVVVFHEKCGKESLQLEIEKIGKPEAEIKQDIANRFCSGVEYPFGKSLRFSCVVGERFLFLRGSRLEMYGEDGSEVIEGVEEELLPEVLLQYFGYDVRSLFDAYWQRTKQDGLDEMVSK